MPETPKTPDPEIIFRYPANWTLIAALALGVVVGAALLLAWAGMPNAQPEDTNNAG